MSIESLSDTPHDGDDPQQTLSRKEVLSEALTMRLNAFMKMDNTRIYNNLSLIHI